MRSLRCIEFLIGCSYAIGDDLSDFGHDFCAEIYSWGEVSIYVFLKVHVWHFVPVLVFSIVRWVLLNGIICKVYKLVCYVFNIVFFTSSSQISFGIKIRLYNPIKCRDKNITSNIEFSLIYQKWIHYVFLQYPCFQGLLWTNCFLDFVQII